MAVATGVNTLVFEEEAHEHPSGANMGKISFRLAVAALALYAILLLTVTFFERFPRLVPDDSPGLAVLVFMLGPFVFLVLGVSASVLGLGCILLGRRGKAYAATAILIGAPVVASSYFLTPFLLWELLGLGG